VDATSSSFGPTTAGSDASTTTTAGRTTPASGEPQTEGATESTSMVSDTGTTASFDESSSSTGTQMQGCSPMVEGTVTETIDVDGVERTYLVVVPASLDGVATEAPVVMAFHGTNGTAEHVAETYGITGAARALYVYPQALWNEPASAVAWDIEVEGVDFAFFDAMLVDLAQKYCVDPNRIFAAGQSNGAFFVNELGCRRPDVLRAIAPVAGGGPSWYPDCTSMMATMIVHGLADDTVPIQQGANARDFWLETNECEPGTSTPTEPPPCGGYSDCSEPVLWCPHAGDHEWPDFAGPAIRSFFLGL
jgi:polyhydroxybutyrate depolymerase